MTRGNQRETDRKRAEQRNAKNNPKKNEDGLTPQQRNERRAGTEGKGTLGVRGPASCRPTWPVQARVCFALPHPPRLCLLI